MTYIQEKYGSTALMFASQDGHIEAIKALLTAPGIDVNQVNVSLQWTPLYLVVSVCFFNIDDCIFVSHQDDNLVHRITHLLTLSR